MPLSKLARYCLDSNGLLVQDALLDRDPDIPNSFKDRKSQGEFHRIYKTYRARPTDFFEYTRMSVETFDYILASIQPALKMDGGYVCAAERLFLTLRYLSTGKTFKQLSVSYSLGRTTVGKTIYQTLRVIWNRLVTKHMSPKLTAEELSEISDKFYSRCQFPNCVGAIDSKCFRISKPAANSVHNKQCANTINTSLLHGVSDADYKFCAIEFDEDANFSKFSEILIKHRFNMPPPKTLPGSSIILPHVLIGNGTYPLKTYLMRPFPSHQLDESKMTFNKRLSRVRETIESAYGMMTNKWQVYNKAIITDTVHAKLIIKVGCLLHNIVRDMDGNSDPDFRRYTSSKSARNKIKKSQRNKKASLRGIEIRNKFKDYFVMND